jgi:hypothetical protein
MKKLSLLLISNLLFIISSMGQAPSWLWAVAAKGSTSDVVLGVKTDPFGNFLSTGYFTSQTLTIGSITLDRIGGQTIFIIKYDPNGKVIWAKTAGGSQYDRGNAIATDAKGNVYITGEFSSATISFGSISINNSGSSGKDIFVAKYDPSGNLLWVKGAGGSSSEEGYGIATDLNGNVFATGRFASFSAKFGGTTLSNSGSTTDFFLAKYDSLGNTLWAKSAGGTLNDGGFGLVTDANGNAYIAGTFFSPTISFESTTFTNAGVVDHFVVKYDGSGNVLWAKSAGGTTNDFGTGIALEPNGGVYVTGQFTSPKISFGGTTLTNQGVGDIFVTKYDASGTVLWAKGIGGKLEDYGRAITSDVAGNVYITGNFYSNTIDFGTTTLTNAGVTDIFVAKLDSSGAMLWATSVGDSMHEFAYGITTDAQNNPVIVGAFFGRNLKVGNDNLKNNSYFFQGYSIFIAKLSNAASKINLLESSDLFISPNPSKGSFVFNCSDVLISTPTTLEIVNTLGETIYTQTVSHRQEIVNHTELIPGMYFVRVINNQYQACLKLLIVQE